jgi:hypothetical protein
MLNIRFPFAKNIIVRIVTHAILEFFQIIRQIKGFLQRGVVQSIVDIFDKRGEK